MAPGSAASIAARVVLLLPRLILLQLQKAHLDHNIDQLLEQMASDQNFPLHRDVHILRSIPGFGRVFSATLLSEASRPLADRNYRALRALTGVAPVTRQSGKTKLVSFRRACHPRLRTALHHAVAAHIQHDQRAGRHYALLRQRGHTYGRAIRGVADRFLALMISMLRQQTLYDPERRKVAQAA